MNGSGAEIQAIGRSEAERAATRLIAANNAHAEELGSLTLDALRRLIGQAFLTLSAGDGDAFLIAFDERADYDSPNFLWFRARFERFVYVDRVAVAASARGRGLARALYETLFRKAQAAGHDRIVAEVNKEPPNPASDAFHAAMGFSVIGSALLANGKAVRYYELRLSDGQPATIPPSL